MQIVLFCWQWVVHTPGCHPTRFDKLECPCRAYHLVAISWKCGHLTRAWNVSHADHVLLQRRVIVDVFHDDLARLSCHVDHLETQISCELDLWSGETHHHLRFRQVSYIDKHRHIMNHSGTSAGVKKELSFDKLCGCLQAVKWRLLLLLIVKKSLNVVVLFGTLKVQSFMLTEVRDCDLLIVVTSSTFLKRKDMLKEKSS